MSKVFAQPSAPVSAMAMGAMTNWPNEPPALTMPVARPRRSGGTRRVAAAISTDDDTITPAYDSGDGIHLTTAGYTALANAITRPITA